MKFYSRLLRLLAMCSVLTLIFCSNPTTPNRYETLKSEFISLTASLQKEVEQFREKSFKRKVTTAVFTQDEYKTVIAGKTSSLSMSDKKLYNNIYRAEGLLHQTQDYFDETDSSLANQTGGFYQPGTDSIFIILDDTATSIPNYERSSLFHELVHALQDQSYNLNTFTKYALSNDQYFALKYIIEGEAELLSLYYLYKLEVGSYPTSNIPVMNVFQIWADTMDAELSSLHAQNASLMVQLPFAWAYFSYGPQFIDHIAGMDWKIIDNTIFTVPPYRMFEVLHPDRYTNKNEYLLDINSFLDTLNEHEVILDVDELGELLASVLFREWDFPDYKSIADGILADNITAYRTVDNDSIRIIWYSYWQDSLQASEFLNKYCQLVNKKKSIVLSSPEQQDSMVVINDSINNIYIEQRKSIVIILETPPEGFLAANLHYLRSVKPYLKGLAKKATASGKTYPVLDKGRWVGDGFLEDPHAGWKRF